MSQNNPSVVKSTVDVFLKLTIVVLLCMLSFVIGAIVGKQFSDNQHQLAILEKNQGDDEVSVAEDDYADDDFEQSVREPSAVRPDLKEDLNASSEEIDKLVNEIIAAEKDPGDSASKPEEGKPSPAKVGSNSKWSPSPSAGPAPTPVLPSVASTTVGKYTIQLASHAKESDATAHAKSLKEKGFAAFYLPAKVKDKMWYRVSVGLFDNREQAIEYRKSLNESTQVSSAIILKITGNEN